MRNVLYNHEFTTEDQFTLENGKLTVLVPVSPNSRNRCEPHQKWLTKCQKNELRRRKKETRSEHFIRLLEHNDWTRAELSRYLGVSRAWVTTVLNKSP